MNESNEFFLSYEQLLKETEQEYLRLVSFINETLVNTPKDNQLFKEWIIENGVKLWYGDRINSATWGNMEWSLYIDFDNHTLRVRWAWDNAMYIDNWWNYIKTSWWYGDEHITPKRINWETIKKIDEWGVIVEDNEILQQHHERQNNRHKTVGRNIIEQRSKIWYKLKRLFSQEKEKNIFELEPKLDQDISKRIEVAELSEMISLAKEWLQKANHIFRQDNDLPPPPTEINQVI